MPVISRAQVYIRAVCVPEALGFRPFPKRGSLIPTEDRSRNLYWKPALQKTWPFLNVLTELTFTEANQLGTP